MVFSEHNPNISFIGGLKFQRKEEIQACVFVKIRASVLQMVFLAIEMHILEYIRIWFPDTVSLQRYVFYNIWSQALNIRFQIHRMRGNITIIHNISVVWIILLWDDNRILTLLFMPTVNGKSPFISLCHLTIAGRQNQINILIAGVSMQWVSVFYYNSIVSYPEESLFCR